MKVIILEEVLDLTDRWHSEGGLVIIAKDLERAKEMLKEEDEVDKNGYHKSYIRPTEKEWNEAIVYDLKDDNVEETFFIFPNAGCC